MKYNNFRRNENLNIVCVFDNDLVLINWVIDGEMIYLIDCFVEIVKVKNVIVVIFMVLSKYL